MRIPEPARFRAGRMTSLGYPTIGSSPVCPLRSCAPRPHIPGMRALPTGGTASSPRRAPSFQLHNVILFLSGILLTETTTVEGFAWLGLPHLLSMEHLVAVGEMDLAGSGELRFKEKKRTETEKRGKKRREEAQARYDQNLAPIRPPIPKEVIDAPTCPLHVPITGLSPVQSCLLPHWLGVSSSSSRPWFRNEEPPT